MRSQLRRILCIDDNADILEIVKLALEVVGGYSLAVCGSGESGLRKAATWSPDLILLDVMMPGMDGLATLRELQESIDLQDIPVLFMTASVTVDEQEEYWRLGVAGVIGKPFNPLNLAEQVETMWRLALERELTGVHPE
ncbi:MAG: response regulator [Acidobacteriota bacterium]